MSSFTKRMIQMFCILAAAVYLLTDILLKMMVNSVEIIEEGDYGITMAVMTAAAGAADALVIALVTGHYTRLLRRIGMSSYPSNEFAFYRNFVLVFMILPVIHAVYLRRYSLPHLEAALNEAYRKIAVMKYDPDYEQKLRGGISDTYGRFLDVQLFGLIAHCGLQWVILFFSAGRLAKIYGEPIRRRRL